MQVILSSFPFIVFQERMRRCFVESWRQLLKILWVKRQQPTIRATGIHGSSLRCFPTTPLLSGTSRPAFVMCSDLNHISLQSVSKTVSYLLIIPGYPRYLSAAQVELPDAVPSIT